MLDQQAVSLDLQCINTIRFLSADCVEKAKSGHPGAPMGLAPLAHVLWSQVMHYNPRNPEWANRDRFVLSAGHASALLYSLLHLTGYDLALKDLMEFRQWESRTPGHPEHGMTPGVETTTGPLGQGFANGVGMAMAERFLAGHFNRPGFEIVNHYTYAICGDGDLMEGLSAEAASLAGHLGLGKLIYFYDSNRISIDGKTDITFTENVALRFEAMGWHVVEVKDGNQDLKGILKAVQSAQSVKDKPSLIIVRTTIGYGSPNKQNTENCHGAPLGPDEIKLAKKNLGWPEDKSFYIPEEVLKFYRSSVERGQSLEKDWNALLARYAAQHPDLYKEWLQYLKGDFGHDWKARLPEFAADEKPMATRAASGILLNAIADLLPNFMGGSADLAHSTNTYLKKHGVFGASNPAGRNIHFGVREHAMGSVVNGMALHGGVKPFCGTFFVFLDYMRPAVRLAAIMHLPSIFIFTHDSIGVGEDGPTHQPVEQLSSLRVIPNTLVLRPADAHETRAAWHEALIRRDGPTALVLTRQNVPSLPASRSRAWEGVQHGGYILDETDRTRKPQLILMASGSEVGLIMEVKAALEKQNLLVRVVSMPSHERFRHESQKYRDEVLPPEVTARVSVEAGLTQGWKEWVGEKGISIGIDRFGASAPGNVLMEKFGFTVDHVVKAAQQVLKNK